MSGDNGDNVDTMLTGDENTTQDLSTLQKKVL
jgi:hypothetical protein